MHWFWRAAIAILIPVVGLACLEEVLWELPALMADYFGAPTEFGWIGTVLFDRLVSSSRRITPISSADWASTIRPRNPLP